MPPAWGVHYLAPFDLLFNAQEFEYHDLGASGQQVPNHAAPVPGLPIHLRRAFGEARHTRYDARMTMLSFRVEEGDAEELQAWSDRLGVDRSEVLRDALRRHLNRLAGEQDAAKWESSPLDEGELALATVADWGPAEDWSDWADAAG